MTNRATAFLTSALTPAQYAEYRRLAALDSRDSVARHKWAWLARYQDYPQTFAKKQATMRAWLRKWGYMAGDGTRLGPGPKGGG